MGDLKQALLETQDMCIGTRMRLACYLTPLCYSLLRPWTATVHERSFPAVLCMLSADMLEKGYEWAAKFGEPLNANSKRYKIQPKCCQLARQGSRYVCAHAWQPTYELPFGDPVTGREWKKDRPDTGTYEGGTFV